MTEKQVKALEAELNNKYYGGKCRFPENLNMPISNEDKITYKKIGIMEMMLSNLAYSGDYFEMCKSYWYVRNLDSSGYDWEQLEALGVEDGMQVVKDLWEEMKADFAAHATIKHCVYTDSEGCTYNSVIWDDEN